MQKMLNEMDLNTCVVNENELVVEEICPGMDVNDDVIGIIIREGCVPTKICKPKKCRPSTCNPA